jgi:hypothetical protein
LKYQSNRYLRPRSERIDIRRQVIRINGIDDLVRSGCAPDPGVADLSGLIAQVVYRHGVSGIYQLRVSDCYV